MSNVATPVASRVPVTAERKAHSLPTNGSQLNESNIYNEYGEYNQYDVYNEYHVYAEYKKWTSNNILRSFERNVSEIICLNISSICFKKTESMVSIETIVNQFVEPRFNLES